MKRYFSPSTKGFYISDVHGIKGAAGAYTPSDAIEITEAQHTTLVNANCTGQEIVVDSGKVIAREIVLTLDEKLAIVRITRDNLLAASDWTQYPDSPLSDEKKAEWSTYRQALRDFPGTLGADFVVNDLVWPATPE